MQDQEDLEWYLSGGESMFERSPTGAILDLLAMQAYVTSPCMRCTDGILPNGNWCPRCRGTGVISLHRPTKGVAGDYMRLRPPAPPARSLDDSKYAAHAMMSTRLARLPARLADAIRLAYGEYGVAAAKTRRGRSWAVSPLTTAGEKLLRGQSDNSISPLQLLTELADIDDLKPVAKRNPLVHQMREQAEALLTKAEQAWGLTAND